MKYLYWLVIIAIAFVGCGGRYNIDQQESSYDFSNAARSNKICVITPRDRNGRIVAEKTAIALRYRFDDVKILPGQEEKADNLKILKAIDADFAVVPNVLFWEDRGFGWAGRTDMIRIHLKAYNLKSPGASVELTFENQSSPIIVGFFEWEDFKPVTLLDHSYTQAVLALFPK